MSHTPNYLLIPAMRIELNSAKTELAERRGMEVITKADILEEVIDAVWRRFGQRADLEWDSVESDESRPWRYLISYMAASTEGAMWNQDVTMNLPQQISNQKDIDSVRKFLMKDTCKVENIDECTVVFTNIFLMNGPS